MTFDATGEDEQKRLGLQRYTQRLLAAEGRAETARIAVEAAHEVLGAPLVGFHDHDPETATLGTLASVDTVRDELGGEPTYRRTGGDRVERLVWGIFETGDPVYTDDLAEYDPEAAGLTPAASGILRPLCEKGVFIVSATTTDAFDEADRALVDILADTLEAALGRVERERRLERQTRQLRCENERLDEFAGLVSHDLRNPLNVAAGRVELAREASTDDTVVGHLDSAAAALDRSFELVDDLLSLARDGRVVEETEPVSLAAVAAEAWDRVDTGTARLECRVNSRVEADRSRLGELFENLFANSVEHGSTGSRPEADDSEASETPRADGKAVDSVEHGSTDSAANGTAEGAVTVTVGALDGGDGFYVADDGVGIPPDDREHVFERGYTSSDDGTGFGLRIVEDITEAHGWSVSVTASETGGARFELRGVGLG